MSLIGAGFKDSKEVLNMKGLKTLAFVLLIVGGAVHLAPGHLEPIVRMGTGYMTLQRIVGMMSILVAAVMMTKKEGK